MRFLKVLALLCVCVSWTAASASASELFARNASAVKLSVSANGQKALLTFKVQTKSGKTVTRRLLVSGAVNALSPSQTTPQVRFAQRSLTTSRKDRKIWKHFKNRCTSYDGPELAFFVVGCQAPDGSYWAVQAWEYWQPFFGYQPWLPYQDDVAYHISHWTGPLAQLDVRADWIDLGKGEAAPHDLVARLTYGGLPVFGYVVKPGGVPGDGYGRVVYIDALDSLLGAGWWRLAGILTRNPSGTLCHALLPQMTYGNYPNPHVVDPGHGTAYRAYVEGPGVTPLVMTEVDDPGAYDANEPARVQLQAAVTALLVQWNAPDACLKGH